MKKGLFILFFALSSSVFGQNQVDFRSMLSVNVQKKINRRVSATCIVAEFQTYDFQELGFAFVDAGFKYKLSNSFGINANYRYFLKKNLDNFYVNHPMLYVDLDYSKGIKRLTIGATSRLQGFYYGKIIDGYRNPSYYSRNRLNLKYRLNYYWQPFTEVEIFIPLNNPKRQSLDQIRYNLGFCYTFNDYLKVEIFERIQQQMNRAPSNTYLLTAMNWYVRF
jgi:hypothetical protein